MIQTLCLLHYLGEVTFKRIGEKFGLDTSDSRICDNSVAFAESPITRMHLFNIQYQAFGHIWFMRLTLDFPRFGCGYEDFIPRLYREYGGFFGADILADLPRPEDINCDYIEYGAALDVGDADAALAKLRERLSAEQLDKGLWAQYKKPHSVVTFLVNKEDASRIEVLAKCHGTALKRIVKDASLHHATGLRLPAAVSSETEGIVLKQQLNRHFKNVDYTIAVS